MHQFVEEWPGLQDQTYRCEQKTGSADLLQGQLSDLT
jgi:hypothetical protein